MRSRQRSWSRMSPAPCTSHAQGGDLVPMPQEAIDALFDRYQNVYGTSRRRENSQ